MRSSLGVLVIATAWLACFSLCREAALRNLLPADWRFRIAAATALWGALLALCVEALSAFRVLNATALFAVWGFINVALLMAARRCVSTRRGHWLAELTEGFKNARAEWKEFSAFAKGCWIVSASIALFLFVVATATPTTNWDAHTYHLPRVMHWIQQGSVEHFATDNTRENEFGPWTGFVIAHLFLFGTGDYLVHLPQWSAMAVSALLASLMVELFATRWGFLPAGPSDNRRIKDAGAVAALLVITIPIGMMESMSPQTDFVTTFWLLSITLFGMDFLSTPSSTTRMIACGIVFGLGLLTKSTILMYSAPFLFAGALMLAFKPVPIGIKLRFAAVFAGCVLALNAGHGSRNYVLFGSPLGSKLVRELVGNEEISPAVFISNAARNLLLHANCGISAVTRAVNAAVTRIHEWTNMKMDDPGTTLSMGSLRWPEELVVYDDFASAPLHVACIGIALLIAVFAPKRHGRLFGYVALIFASAALFAATLKFQLYHSRFHLAYLAMLMPVVALVLAMRTPRWLLATVTASFVAYAGLCMRVNEARPIFDPSFRALPRESQYLSKHAPTWTPAWQSIADEVAASGPQQIGLKLEFNAFEYPFWVMLRNRGAVATIDHTFVEDVSRALERKTPGPTVIITFVRPVPPQSAQAYPYKTIHRPLMAIWQHKPNAPHARSLP